ncbi:hypothetical protein Emed_007510 [Eimeria media]
MSGGGLEGLASSEKRGAPPDASWGPLPLSGDAEAISFPSSSSGMHACAASPKEEGDLEQQSEGLQHQHEIVSPPPEEEEGGGPPGGAPLSVPRLPSPLPFESLWRLSLLLLIAVGPFLSMLVFVSLVHNVGAAMLWMHWGCMLLAPAVYIHLATDGWSYYLHVCAAQGPQGGRWKHQGPWAVLGFVAGGASCYLGYLLLDLLLDRLWGISITSALRERALSMGLQQPFWICLLLAIYFVLFNPLIEEIFWRVFLYRELGAGVFGSAAAGLLEVYEAPPLKFRIPLTWRGGERRRAGGERGPLPSKLLGQQGGPPPSQQLEALGGAPPAAEREAAIFGRGENEYASAPEPFVSLEEEKATFGEHRKEVFYAKNLKGSDEAADVYVEERTPPASPHRHAFKYPATAPTTVEAAAAASDSSSSSSSSSSRSNSREELEPHRRRRVIAYYDLRVPPLGLLMLAAAYSSYHMVIFDSLLGPAYVFPAFFLICALGALLLFLRNNNRFGLLVATSLHAGVDVGVVLVVGRCLGFL